MYIYVLFKYQDIPKQKANNIFSILNWNKFQTIVSRISIHIIVIFDEVLQINKNFDYKYQNKNIIISHH